MRPFYQKPRDTFASERVAAPPPLVLSSSARKSTQTKLLQKNKQASGTGISTTLTEPGASTPTKPALAPWAQRTKRLSSGGVTNTGKSAEDDGRAGDGLGEEGNRSDWASRAIEYLHNVDNKSVLVLNENSESPNTWQDYKACISNVDQVFPSLQEIERNHNEPAPNRSITTNNTQTPEHHQHPTQQAEDPNPKLPNVSFARLQTKEDEDCVNCKKSDDRMKGMTNTLFEYKTNLLSLQRQVEKLQAENAELRANETRLLARIDAETQPIASSTPSVDSCASLGNMSFNSFHSGKRFISEIVDELVGLSLQIVSRRHIYGTSVHSQRRKRFEGRTLSAAEIKAIVYVDTVPRRPQLDFRDPQDNSENPFEHVIESKPYAQVPLDSSDTSVHPFRHEIKKLHYSKEQLRKPKRFGRFIDMYEDDPYFAFIDNVRDFHDMIAHLERQREVAVDLENHSLRSYQGFICLIQFSSRDYDFVVDALRLREHMSKLRPLFCNPAIVKVFHGADMDILWLQRDLRMYVVNMFDTGQATRVLKYEKFSLAYLLERFVNVKVDKSLQTADWRQRPLSRKMVQYARQDTHYLLAIYDRLRCELVDKNFVHAYNPSERDAYKGNKSLLHFVLDRSASICLRSYSKPAITERTVLSLLKRHTTLLELESCIEKSEFAALVSRLLFWRDRVGRIRDESAQYVLPDLDLLALSRFAPTTFCALQDAYRWLSSILNETREVPRLVKLLRSSLLFEVNTVLEEHR